MNSKKHYFGKAKNLWLIAICILAVIVLLASNFTFKQNNTVDELLGLEYGYVNNGVALVRGDFGADIVANERDILNRLDKINRYGFSDVFSELKLVKKFNTAVGSIYRFEQYYQNIEVFGRQINVTVAKNGKISSVNGNYLADINVDLSATKLAKGRYVIYSLDTSPILAYEYFENNNRVFCNAKNEKVIIQIPLAPGAKIPTESVDLELTDHNGNKIVLPVEKTQDNTYYLADAKRNIYVHNAKNNTFDNDYIFGDVYQSNSGDFDDANAVTAYKALLKSYDFFANEANTGVVGGVQGIDGSCDNIHDNASKNGEIIVRLYMHYGSNYNNAAYIVNQNLAQREAVLIIGDGDGVNYKNFAQAEDVVGHEYQHAVTQYATELIYVNASGAISEALSDIFGALIEGKDMSSEGFWQIGEDIVIGKNSMRDMKNPEKNNLPSRVLSGNAKEFCYRSHSHEWSNCDNGGVHTNSTIISHIFYKMYASDKAFFTQAELSKLWYNAIFKLTSTATYEELRLAVEQTALELKYGKDRISIISKLFEEADIIAKIGRVSVQFVNYKGDILKTVVGEGGDYFVVPDLNGADEGEITGFWTEDKYKQKFEIGNSYKMPPYDLRLNAVNFARPWNDSELKTLSGSGDKFDPYLITCAEDLASLAFYYNTEHPIHSSKNTYFSLVHYQLAADIDLLNVNWKPIGNSERNQFYGNFDGNGFTISNLNIQNTKNVHYYGLFGVNAGSIKNIKISSGYLDEQTGDLGSIVGLNKGEVDSCYNNATIVGGMGKWNNVGGIVGYNWSGKVTNSYNSAEVSGYYAGGIFGNNICTGSKYKGDKIVPSPVVMSNNINVGNIKGIIAGGIGGCAANTYIVNCINTGEISALNSSDEQYLGGIAGQLNIPTKAIYYDGYTDQENAGILGCNNTGKINNNGVKFAGAIAGIFAHNDTTGNTVSEKNVFKYQSEVKAFGDNVVFDGDRVIGEMPRRSSDSLFEGDFDFDNAEFMQDFSAWSVFAGVSIFDSNTTYKFTNGAMPQIKKEQYWIDYYADSFSGGDGSEKSPYQISSAEELARLAYLVAIRNNNNYYIASNYILTDDIDLAGKKWISIGGNFWTKSTESYYYNTSYGLPFYGLFDGAGHTISNMSVGNDSFKLLENLSDGYFESLPGLFGILSNATVKNLNIQNVNVINEYRDSGAIASIVKNDVNINNCKVIGGAVTSISTSGGIAGSSEGSGHDIKLDLVKTQLNISASVAGGIVGNINDWYVSKSTISNSVNNSRILAFCQSQYYIGASGGGILGQANNNVSIINCINQGEVIGYSCWNNIGGAIGNIYVTRYNVIDVDIVGFKNTSKAVAYGQENYLGYGVGRINSQADKNQITLNISKSMVVGNVMFDKNNFSNVGELKLIFDNYIVGLTEDSYYFAFSDIKNFFDTDCWSDMDAEAANNFYELVGGIRVSFKVTFLDFQGLVIGQTIIRYNETAIPPEVSERPAEVDKVYTHIGWDKSLEKVTEDMTVQAVYQTSVRLYKISFYDYNNQLIESYELEYGENIIPPENIENIVIVGNKRYRFVGWSENIDKVSSDSTVKAKYEMIDDKLDNIIFAMAFITTLSLIAAIICTDLIKIKRRKRR